MLKKRLAALALAVMMACASAVPAFAAAAPAPDAAALSEDNALVSIRIEATDNAVYGSPFEVGIRADPEDTQYIAVVLGVSGQAKGFVTLLLPEKVRILLELVPLPASMSADPANTRDFNLYRYLKQLIDGNDVDVLIRVAEELTALMEILQYYVPALQDVVTGMRSALNLIRRFLPEGLVTHIYVDEQPVDAGNYVAGAVTLSRSDVNTGGFALFKIAPKREGVRQYWAQQTPASMTVERRPRCSSSRTASIVVPAGEHTASRSASGCAPVAATISTAPLTVCTASFMATSRASPMRTPPSASALARRLVCTRGRCAGQM